MFCYINMYEVYYQMCPYKASREIYNLRNAESRLITAVTRWANGVVMYTPEAEGFQFYSQDKETTREVMTS